MPRPIRGADTVRVEGLARFRRELKAIDQEKALEADLKDANHRVAQLVVLRARIRAASQGRLAAKAAETLKASRSGVRAEVSFGGREAPFAGGAEFGAYRNKLRLKKNTGGRAYIVRKETAREIARATARIESQTRMRHETVKKGSAGGVAVRVTGQIRGWNQFKEWRGNKPGAGYFLFPTIRDSAAEIVEIYGDELDRITRKAFPD